MPNLSAIPYLLHYNTTERVGDEYDRSQLFVLFFSFIDQTTKQIFGMIHDVCRCIAKCSIGIVPKSKHPRFRNIAWEEIFRPECLRFRIRPGFSRISVETMDNNDTVK